MITEFILFVLVGAVATGLYMAVAFALEGRMAIAWVIFWAFLVSLPLAYALQRWLVFSTDAGHFGVAPKFFLVQLMGLGINQLSAWLLILMLDETRTTMRRLIIALSYLIAGLGVYVLMRFWVFAG